MRRSQGGTVSIFSKRTTTTMKMSPPRPSHSAGSRMVAAASIVLFSSMIITPKSSLSLGLVSAQSTDQTDRAILEKFFDNAGGENWEHKHKWKESDNVCNWYGIVCDDEPLNDQDDDDYYGAYDDDAVDDDDDDDAPLDDDDTNGNGNRKLFFEVDTSTMSDRELEQYVIEQRRSKRDAKRRNIANKRRRKRRLQTNRDHPGRRNVMDDDGRRIQDDDDDDAQDFDDDNIDDDGAGKTMQSGIIKAIRLGGNNLNGTLVSEIYDLQTLAELDVKDNPDFKVNLNGIGKLKELETLYLSNVDIVKSDLQGLGEATALRELHLTNNDLTGDIPEEIYKLTLLDALYIAFNNFDGSFPKGLYNTSLTELWAYDNLFTGSLPDDINNGLPDLRRLVLGGNAWSGSIPESFMKLRAMRHMSIRNLRDTMELAGPGLNGPLPSFHGQKFIKALHLNHNNLTGTIPTGLLKNVEDKDTLSVNLTHNMLTGVVPYELVRFTRLELDVTANRLTGFASGLCNPDGSYNNTNMTNWLDGQVQDYGCDAILCPADSASAVGRAISDAMECTPCELPDGFQDWDDDDDDGFVDDDDYYNDDDNNNRRLRFRRNLQNNESEGDDTTFVPDVTPYVGKLQCEYVDDDGTTVVDKTGDEIADLDGYGEERSILIQLYQALGGDNWDYKDHWLDDTKGICVWYGITCRVVDGPDAGDSAVERINLDGNNLSGDVPSIIYNLPDLKEISIMRNDVTITFNNIANATELENLYLEGIRLSDLNGVENAKGLKKLIASDNGLSGPFPSNLYGLERLTELMLDDNELTGALPSDVSAWTKMTRFDVTRNKLTGQLPSFDSWKDLRVLDLSNNLWSGTLPKGLADMKKLQVLAIYGSDKKDTSNGIGGPLLDFADCPELMEIYLEDNSLTGTISHQFLASNDYTNRTVYVALSRNNLNGSIPIELSKFDRLTITLDNNDITDIPEELCNQTGWMEGEVAEFGCDAILCPPGTYHTEIGRATKLLGDCATCTTLQSDPSLGNTACDDTGSGSGNEGEEGEGGTYTPGDGDTSKEREILTQFFTATGGPQWKMKENWLSDDVSVCKWYGVTCVNGDDTAMAGIIRIELMDNGLVGSLTSDLYKLPLLSEIDFDKNPGLKVHFEGVGNSQALTRFRMSGTQVDLTGIDDAKYLSYIDCASAGLTGPLPDALFNMPQLVSLELTANSLTGHITHHIEKWSNMTDLYLDHNQFSGTLTTHIGKLTNLKELALSRNNLIGPLPSELNKLVNLELFGAKEQRNSDGTRTLNGTIPSFHNSPNLNEIYLSENILSGDIPDNLLESSNARSSDSYIVYLGLDDNRLTGTLPESLDTIQNLIIDINDNFIEKVPDTFCDDDNAQWMNGAVGKYGCDAILCPKGHYLAPTGRQVQPDKPCEKCNVVGGAAYMGSTSCLSLSEVVGRPILKAIYEQLGGDDWYNNDNWLQENKEVCDWYGVNCTSDDKTIQSITLNSNNLRGNMPEDIWQIPGLQTVWLYSNPLLDVTFQNVNKANKLKTLLIDSTGISNINGLEQASDTLEELDLRFNNLEGEFPYREIAELTNLKVLSIANNRLSGELNSYGLGDKSKLQKLRLGGNQFTGNLPDFSTFPALQQLDLSDNFFESEIPAVFLKDVIDTSSPITVDLASNKLYGTVPSEPFERFNDLTLYLRGNMFEGINQQLCSKVNWNNGDVGTYGCDGLMCPPHTYAPTGRQRNTDEPCERCDRPTAFFAGAYECQATSSDVRNESSSATTIRTAAGMLLTFMFVTGTTVGIMFFLKP